jgi:hypothetical protein
MKHKSTSRHDCTDGLLSTTTLFDPEEIFPNLPVREKLRKFEHYFLMTITSMEMTPTNIRTTSKIQDQVLISPRFKSSVFI